MFGRRKNTKGSSDSDTGASVDRPTQEKAVGVSGQSSPVQALDDENYIDGPYDFSELGDIAEHTSNTGIPLLDLGSMLVAVPPPGQVQAEITAQGQPVLHIGTEYARVTIQAFAAPNSGGLWRQIAGELREGLKDDGAEVSIVDGPWGREVLASRNDTVMRFVGVDGNRWMLQALIVSNTESVDSAAEFGRSVIANSIVKREGGPMPVREALPMTVPDEILKALQQAAIQQQRAQQSAAEEAQVQRQIGIDAAGVSVQNPRPKRSAMQQLREDEI